MKHTGGCHCGAVRYETELADSNAMECNCSICLKRGSILAFAPASAFTVLQGEDRLTDYQFNKKIIHHLFCKTCGILPFARGTGPDGTAMVAVNIRTIDNVDLSAYKITAYTGKDL